MSPHYLLACGEQESTDNRHSPHCIQMIIRPVSMHKETDNIGEEHVQYA